MHLNTNPLQNSLRWRTVVFAMLVSIILSLGSPVMVAAQMGPPDMGPPDMGPPDMGPPDMGPPDHGTT
ncbi:MAG: hypothetical protein ACJ0KD_03665 [Dehalococcoidia bacterium]